MWYWKDTLNIAKGYGDHLLAPIWQLGLDILNGNLQTDFPQAYHNSDIVFAKRIATSPVNLAHLS